MADDRFAIDSHKLVYHPRRVAQWLEAADDWERVRAVYPLYMELSPMGACNHRCTFCAVDFVGYKPDRLDVGMLAERLPEMGRLGVRSIMYAGEGEPMLHKEMAAIIRLTHAAGIDVALTSNLTILPDDFVDTALPHVAWIKASINAGDAETYARIHRTRPGDFHKAVAHLTRLAEVRRARGLSCTLGAQALLLPENAAEMVRLARLCRDAIGLDYLVIKPYSQHLRSITRTYQGLDYKDYAALGDELAALTTRDFQVVFRRQTMAHVVDAPGYTRCHATPFFWAYVMANGVVSGCSAFLGDVRFEYGNLNQEGFQQIWEGERRRQGWEFVRHHLDIQQCRRGCRMDAVNRYLHLLKEGGVEHVNFI